MFTLEREKLSLAQKILRLGIWHWNLKDNSLSWDDRLYEIYGISPSVGGVTYQKWADLLDPVDLKEVEQSAASLIAGTSDHFDHVFRARKKDGTPLWIRTVARLFRDQGGGPGEILGANYDLTEEIINKITIKNLMARLDLVSEEHDLGFWEWNPTQKTMLWDESMVRIWGRPPKTSPLDIPVADLWEGVHPEDQPLFQSLMQNMMGSRESEGRIIRILRPDSAVRFVKMKARVLGDGDHHGKRLMGVCYDVTKQVLNDRDMDRLKNIYTQKSKLASLGQLAGGIGHEINNSLAIILGFTQKMMLEKSSPQLQEGEVALPWLQKIYKAGLRIKAISDGLKDLQHSMHQVHGSVVDLHGFVQGIVSLLSSEFLRQGIQIQLKSPGQDCPVQADRGEMQQVLVALINHSVDTVPHRDGKKSIEITIDNHESSLILKVKHSDSGDFVPSLNEGEDLDLVESRVFAESWGGRLTVELESDHERIYCLEIPKAVKPTLDQVEPPLGVPGLVVVVSQDSDQRQRIHDYFTKVQFQIKIFATSSLAMDFLSTVQHVDLIVVDSQLIDMDGLSLIVQINDKNLAPKALKIVLGEQDRDNLEKRAQDFRFGMVDGVLEKPVSKKDLDRLVYRIANRDRTDPKVS